MLTCSLQNSVESSEGLFVLEAICVMVLEVADIW